MEFIDASCALMALGGSISIIVLRTRTRRRVERALERGMAGTSVGRTFVEPTTEQPQLVRFPGRGA